jgi:NAD(P)-dependent dehydrogenase (short-subunit alcohol dehydrogenase family)
VDEGLGLGGDGHVGGTLASRNVLLREGLLDGVSVLAAPRTSATDACVALGAQVAALEVDLLDEAATLAAASDLRAACVVVDAGPLFGAGGESALRAGLDGTWSALHAAFAPELAGQALLIAPRPDAGPFAEALASGLENLARTLSIEWSRHGWRIVAIRPGRLASDAEVAELVAFLASPAGAYYSGCALSLG